MSLRVKILTGVLLVCSGTLTAFLGEWEGNGQNVVYADKLAGGLPTVCKGITRYTSPDPVRVGDFWSDARCAEVESLVIAKGQLSLADCLTNQAIGQHTFDALSSHGHNFGVPTTCASRAVGLINAGRIAEGCKALAWSADGTTPVWAYVTGGDGRKTFVRGLHNRRLAEMRLCLK
ncbi:lysozyme [Pseudomonas syringae]|uniref:lysozyme n=1 Tax=Pseudomonas syringae TaxID=317 RepID=UPI0018E66070|nr:lysozyme [Pseudomonas syringae]MBI6750056.1 lysozyme [Pseudomonas syringae]MBI6769080.1 lysozyme [Pseudomonas syringae]MBI6773915.1 lysozyme [Pseudomonas syringae]MBI6790506.1 lysozyme [Pseudomonas syringae]MBI6800629.1 lysozyme [Pseudomonas syringae]